MKKNWITILIILLVIVCIGLTMHLLANSSIPSAFLDNIRKLHGK